MRGGTLMGRLVMTMVAAMVVGQMGLSARVNPDPNAPLWCQIDPGAQQWKIWGGRDAAGFWGLWSDWQADIACSGGSEFGCLFTAARQMMWWNSASGTWQDTGHGWQATTETQQCYQGLPPAHYDWADAWRFQPRGYTYLLRTALINGPAGGPMKNITKHEYNFN
jgi:hypothetical protein